MIDDAAMQPIEAMKISVHHIPAMEQEYVFGEGHGGPSKKDDLVRKSTKEEKNYLITGRRPLHQDGGQRDLV
uniref:Uncharacterized protein n=1 Tax=Romanomermis culicivorax TaxID=13658 RepID=A0A915IVE0_ROMCU